MEIFKRGKYLRRIEKELTNRKILFLIGPRQAGKTNLMMSLSFFGLIQSDEFVFLSMDQYVGTSFRDTDDFYDFIVLKGGKRDPKYILLDEVQSMENIAILLKWLYDRWKQEGKDIKLICSGSGSLAVFQGIHESLVGRKSIIFVYPLSFGEFLDYKWFDISLIQGTATSPSVVSSVQNYTQEYIAFGGYPEVVFSIGEEQKLSILRGIYEDYILRDISFFLREKEIMAFQKFFPLVASKVCSLVKLDAIVQETGISRRLVERFLFLLENTFVTASLPAFVQKKEKEVFSHKKLYFVDSGFLRILLGSTYFVGDNKWKMVENFIFGELEKNKQENTVIRYYRKKSQAEIDFILENTITGKVIPIEVKSGSTDTFPQVFHSFIEDYHDMINHFAILNSELCKSRDIAWIPVEVLPYGMVQIVE